jgi:hypothetical protein
LDEKMNNNEFKKSKNGQYTVYTLESATGGSTSAASMGSVSKPMGGVQRRGNNLITQEGDKDKIDASKPRNFVAKNAKTGGAGAHKDKKKEQKQGNEKHKKPYMEDHEVSMASNELKSIHSDAQKLLGLVQQYGENGDLQAWQQSKITKAADYLNSVLQSIGGEQGVAEGLDKNVVKSVMVGNFRHDLVNTGFGWQVRIYIGDKLYDTDMTKNTEEKGLAALENAVAYTENQINTKRQGVAEGLNEPPVSYREMINSVQKQYTKWYSELVNHYAQLGNSSDEFKKKIVAAYNAYKNGQSVAHIPIVGPVKEQGVAEGLSKRDQQDVAAIKAAIERLQAQLSHPNADRDAIQQSIAHEKKRLALYGVTEAAYNPDTFVGKKGTYKGYGITQEGPRQWGISSSVRKFPTLDAAKRHIDKNLVAEGQTPEQEIERLKLRQNAEHGKAPLRRQAATQARIRELEKQIKDNQGVAEGYYDLNDMQPIDLSSNPSFKEIVDRYTQLYYQGHEGDYGDEESAESDAIEQYVAKRFGQKGSNHLQKAAQASFRGRDDGHGQGHLRSSNLGRPNQPGGDFRTTKAGKMHGQDVKVTKNRVASRLGSHPAPNLPEQGVAEGPELKKAKREYNQAAKDAGGDWAGAGKKIDNMKKGLRQKDVGKDKSVAETDGYMEGLMQKLAEKIPASAPVDVWVQDFQKADPNKYHQFKNKTPAKKAQMAVAASYAAKNPDKKK